ncbi:MAG: helix-turn-helix transcriptional regulator [Pseudomonadota bacterium]
MTDQSDEIPGDGPEYLTVKELAALLRIKERKVYDLAASGAAPCVRATGKLLFPRRDIDAWLAASRSDPAAEAPPPPRAAPPAASPASGAAPAPPPAVFLGSHDPLLEWALREAQAGLATYFDSSEDGLTRLLAGEGAATGLHLFDPETEEWNAPVVARRCAGRPFVLVEWARRRRGLLFRESNPVARLAELRGKRFAARQAEAGAQRLLTHLAADAGLALGAVDMALVARSEADAALAVAEGEADACLGLEVLARRAGLGFTPLIEERFDLLVDRRSWFEPPFQAFLGFLESEAFARKTAAAIGYDFSRIGRVHWNGG